MVDVGYHLEFCGHRVIENVKQIINENGKIVFNSADNEEQYVLDKESIDWIVPHEDIKATSIPYVESHFVKHETVSEAIDELNEKPSELLKTNKEKFEEVFGMPPKDNLSICDIVDCKRSYCDGCKFYRPWMMRDAWNGIWKE